MSKSWVLVIIISGAIANGGGVGITSVKGFETLEACKIALTKLQRDLRRQGMREYPRMFASCLLVSPGKPLPSE